MNPIRLGGARLRQLRWLAPERWVRSAAEQAQQVADEERQQPGADCRHEPGGDATLSLYVAQRGRWPGISRGSSAVAPRMGLRPSTRVRAADSVLDHAKKAIELEDIDVRVSALEEATKDQKR